MSRILPTLLVFISGYANKENVFYCLNVNYVPYFHFSGDQQLLSVPSVFDAFMQLPSPKQSTEVQSERTEELVVEELTDVMTEEERERMKDKQREEFEQKKLSWD